MATVGAGLGLVEFCKQAAKRNYTGPEFLSGIPGTIGGAVAMSAGATFDNKRYSIGDAIESIRALNMAGRTVCLGKKDLHFRYRRSNVRRFIILEVTFTLKKAEITTIRNRIKTILRHRAARQDYSYPNAGCIFKNPCRTMPAGMLIDRSGCKGLRCGGAMVSKKHANFILNFNGATAADVLQLIRIIQERVRNKFGVTLQREISLVP